MGTHGLWLFGALVLGWGGGRMPCAALLSASVTLTLALSRRAGAGETMIAMIFNDWNDGCWLFGIASGFEGLRDEGGWGSPSGPSSPACPARCARAPFATKGAGGSQTCPCRWPPLSFGHFPRERGKPGHPALPLDSGCRRNDESVAGDGVEWWFWFGESLFLRRCALLPSRCLGRSRTAPTGCGSFADRIGGCGENHDGHDLE